MLGIIFTVLAVLFAIHGVGEAGGKTITVDDDGGADYLKIQDAINASEDGDHIYVYNGTYYENVVVNKSVSLIGNGSEVTTIDGGGDGDVVTITGNWTTVTGFTVKGSGSGNWDVGIEIKADNVTVSSNNCSGNIHGIISIRHMNGTIRNNTCSRNGRDGISIYYASHYVLEENSCIGNRYGIQSFYSDYITMVNNSCSGNDGGIHARTSLYNVLSHCTLFGNFNGISLSRGGGHEVYNCQIINNYNGFYLSETGSLKIHQNNISLNNNGMNLSESQYVSIHDNLFRDNQVGLLVEDSFRNSIQNNTITLNYQGFLLLGSTMDDEIIFNTITDNDNFGINSTEGGKVNATHNWWGHSSGPYHPILNPSGKGDNVTDNVEFEPWLSQPSREPWTWYVDDDAADGGNGSIEHPFNKIQDAINASGDGDNIYVYNGTYYENVVVNKSVSLIGNGSEVTTIDGGEDGDVVTITADWINLSGFTITHGDMGITVRSNNNSIINNNCLFNEVTGIFVSSSDGNIFSDNYCSNNQHGLRIDGSHENNITNNALSQNIKGIFLSNSDNNSLSNNNCSHNDNGIYTFGSNHVNVSNNRCVENHIGIFLHTMENNTILNNNCSKNDDSGILIRYSIDSAFINNSCTHNKNGISFLYVNNNTISNNTYYYNYLTGIRTQYSYNTTIIDNNCPHNKIGIYLISSGNNIILNNTITKNEVGISLSASSEENTAHYNTIFDNTEFGINATNCLGCTINATNNWWGDALGPFHPTKNPGGKGDNVTDYVFFDPWIGKTKTWYVDDDAPPGGNGSIDWPFNLIQNAINASEDGDTIRVFEGLYYENVVVDRSVSLIGNGSEWTTIDGNGTGDVVNITKDWVNISGFRLRRGGSNWWNAGIKVQSQNNHIFNNYCSYNVQGIYLDAVNNNTLSNNICSHNSVDGIYLYPSDFNILINNTCTNNVRGISLWYSDSNTLENNTCSNNNVGIYFYEDCTRNVLINNTCSGNSDDGISLNVEWDQNNILTHNTCMNNDYHGISLWDGQYIITNNSCSDNYGSGIFLRSSGGHSTISNNTCSNNEDGIWLEHAYNSILSNNTCYLNNNYGILLSSSHNNILMKNNCSNNAYLGIYLWDSNKNTITDTTCLSNGDYGLCIWSSDDNIVTNNTIAGNEVGIYLKLSSEYNTAYYNKIFDNTECGINAVNNSGYAIEATMNWWGDDSGPYHLENNSAGKGDNVTDYVIFDPWIGKPRTWYVDDDAPLGGNGSIDWPFNRIQNAINASEDGNKIRVFNGTYYENVVVNKSVSLIGNGSEVTTIDGWGNGDVVFITADRVNISGFRVTGSGSDWPDSGIRVEANNSQIFENNCSNNQIIGIFFYSSNNNTLTNNTSHNNIWGIRLHLSSGNTLMNNSFSYNVGMGLYLTYSNTNIISNTTCINNSEGIHIYNSKDYKIVNSICSNNKYFGIYLTESNNITIVNNTYEFNGEIGISLEVSENNSILNNTISGNLVGMHINYGSNNNSAHFNNIHNNSEYGIKSVCLINATNNWWGHNTGPYHPTLNPEGTGDNITEDVLFDPWIGKDILENQGKLSGWIGDNHGNDLENVRIHIQGDTSFETFTNKSGYYEISNLPIVEYLWTITLSKYGYSTSREYIPIDDDSEYDHTLLDFMSSYYVDDDAPQGGDGSFEHPLNKIQDALDYATDGDIIRVFEGTYYENVIVNNSVDLIGNGSVNTVIDGGENWDVVTISVDWVNLSGFTVTGSGGGYAGIIAHSDHNHIFENNCSNNWCGIRLSHSSDCTIENNTCSNNSRGIYLKDSSNNTVSNNTCSHNYRGIILSSSSYCTITNNKCENNDEGIYLQGSDHSTLTYNLCFSNNYHGIELFLSNYCTIMNNKYENNDEGIYLLLSSNCIIKTNIITGNRIGISLRINSKDNIARNNYIFDNIKIGINATENNVYFINATQNYWGNPSGPYHPVNNSLGLGDNITDYVLFEPWLDENGNLVYLPEDSDEDGPSPHPLVLPLLLLILVCLFVSLFVVVKTPDKNISRTITSQSQKDQPASKVWDASDSFEIAKNALQCQSCYNLLELGEFERPIRPICPKCGNDSLKIVTDSDPIMRGRKNED